MFLVLDTNLGIPLDTNPTTFHFFHFRQFFSSFVVIFCFLRLCERWISVDQLCNTCRRNRAAPSVLEWTR
ncbi:hypothetical protein RclHR1_05070017 [Rhizophagus clarus]|uniref:Uncharacterized protein n=1 Tax=Rhizophagus clarus TaxID=94130 RepID=A0A2Z6RR12_9GLOM|nr:hypothetical protein RclHR1_05070017 [Rhizophagus clarus]